MEITHTDGQKVGRFFWKGIFSFHFGNHGSFFNGS
jgi:hypothetical protein